MPNFYKLDFEDANPAYAATRNINELIKGMLANRQAAIEQKTMGQRMDETLKQMQLANTINEPIAQRAPQFAEANLQDILSGSLEKRAKAGEAGARTGLINKQIEWLPETEKTKLIKAISSAGMTGYYNSPQRALAQMQNNPGFQELASKNPEMAKNIMAAQYSVAQKAAGGQPNNMNQIISSILGAKNPQDVQNVAQSGILQQQGQEQQQPAYQPTEDELRGFQETLSNVSEKKGTTAAIMNARAAGANVVGLLNIAEKNLPAASKYAGLLGKAKGITENAMGQMQQDYPEDYNAFRQFVDIDVPMLAGDLRREMLQNATDEQRKELEAVVNPVTWYNTPERAIKMFQHLKYDVMPTIHSGMAKSTSSQRKILEEAGKDTTKPNYDMNTSGSNSGMVTIEHDGEHWQIPANKVEEAKKRGARVVGNG